jgi:hypothetical protein
MAILFQEKRREEYRKGVWNNPRGEGDFGRAVIILFGLVVLLQFIIVPALATEPTVIITGYEVTPAVLMPGDMGTVTVTLKHTAQAASETENTGIMSTGIVTSTKTTGINTYIENVHLEGNGIRVLSEDFDHPGDLGPGQSIPVTFVIQAPDDSGIFFPEVRVDVESGRSTRYPVTVNVNTDISTQKKPVLSVTQLLPDRVAPGERCEAKITLENTGLNRASDIWVSANPDVASLVLTSPGRYYTEHLDPGECSNITLQFATDKNTPIGLDPVNLVITYRDLGGTIEKQTEIIAIPVKGRADIAISSVTTDPVRPDPGSIFTLIVRVENTGTDRATSVRAMLDSPFAGTKEAFIGSIDKDSDAPGIFYLQATKDGTVPVNITLSYNDDFGPHTVIEHATLMTRPSSVIPLVVAGVLIVCIGAGAVYWYVRIRPEKKHA